MATASQNEMMINLGVELSKQDLNKVRSTMKYIAEQGDKFDLHVTPKSLKNLSQSITNAITVGARGSNLNDIFDTKAKSILDAFAKAQMNISHMEIAGKDEKEILKIRQKMYDDQEEATHVELAELTKIATQQEAAAKQWKEMSSTKGRGAMAHGLVDGFKTGLNHLHGKDVAGFSKLLIGSLSKGIARKAAATAGAASSAGTVEAAEGLTKAAAGLSVVAATVAVVAGAVAAVVALLVMADEQAKEFNTAMLEGAGGADIAFSAADAVGVEMNDTLSAGRKAAIDMALTWRGQAKDYTAMLGQLNQAGITFKRMAADGEDQSKAMEGWMKTTLVWSKNFGVSTSEMAANIAELSNNFGMTQKDIIDQYAGIMAAAQGSSMGTKRFFSAVSQATAGLALYNVRLDQAAGLLGITAKILGGADAGEFVKSLEQGMKDDPMTERFKKLALLGSSAVNSVDSSLDRAQKNFTDNLADGAQKALSDAGITVTGDLGKEFSKMSEGQREAITDALSKSSDPNANKANTALLEIARLQKGTSGTIEDMAAAADGIDAQATLANTLTNFQGTRVDQQNGAQLAATQAANGWSAKQLLQAQDMSASLYAQYQNDVKTGKDGGKWAKQGNESDTQAWNRWMNYSSTAAGAAAKDAKDLAVMSADEIARQSMDNTNSILDWLKNEGASLLNDISDGIMGLLAHFDAVGADQIKARKDAEKQNAEMTDTLSDQLATLDTNMSKQTAIIASKGVGSTEGKAAAAHLADMTALQAQLQDQIGVSKDAGRAIKTTVGNSVADVLSKASDTANAGDTARWGRMNGIAPENAADAFAAVQSASQDAYVNAHVPTDAMGVPIQSEVDSSGMASGMSAADAMTAQWQSMGTGVGPLTGTDSDPMFDMLDQGDDAQDTQDKQTKLMKTAKVQATKGLKLQSDILDFYNKSLQGVEQKAMTASLKEMAAEELVSALGVDPKDAAQDIADAVAGNGMSQAFMDKFANADDHDKTLANQLGGVKLKPVANDFIMRPGQAAQRFSPGDTVVGTKAGGPLAGGGGGVTNIYVNGGDPSQVYNTVKSAMKNSGVRP